MLHVLSSAVLLQDVQDFMQQLLGAIADHFPHQALWAMATVCKSTVRARQVRQGLPADKTNNGQRSAAHTAQIATNMCSVRLTFARI
jgi:hypothetical protein